MHVYRQLFNQIIAPEHLFAAWDTFKLGKRHKPDVQVFERDLEENIFQLHHDLRTKTYAHGAYTSFFIHDPKQRHIYKATVRDRILHHAVYAVLQPLFEPTFIPTSFACRIGYGTHKGVAALEGMLRRISRNGTRPCFALKCDIQKFFDSVDHDMLLPLIRSRIHDVDTIWLIERIIASYSVDGRERERESKSVARYSNRESDEPAFCKRVYECPRSIREAYIESEGVCALYR
ncbi:hypothetical protein HY629_01205 [Candidatus Uhrbacteria bacterium]|nr:hypothetical protein [Candidatus Uhrbacteria bacterium]